MKVWSATTPSSSTETTSCIHRSLRLGEAHPGSKHGRLQGALGQQSGSHACPPHSPFTEVIQDAVLKGVGGQHRRCHGAGGKVLSRAQRKPR